MTTGGSSQKLKKPKESKELKDFNPEALAGAKAWLESEKEHIPTSVFLILQHVIVFAALMETKQHTLAEIRDLLLKAWGLKRSSEKTEPIREKPAKPKNTKQKKKALGRHEGRARGVPSLVKDNAAAGESGGDKAGESGGDKAGENGGDKAGENGGDKAGENGGDKAGTNAQENSGKGEAPSPGNVDTPKKRRSSAIESGDDGSGGCAESLHPSFEGGESNGSSQHEPVMGALTEEYLVKRILNPEQWSKEQTEVRKVELKVKDLEIRWIERNVVLDEIVNTATGEVIRAENPIAPSTSKYSYRAIVSMAILHVGNQLPIHRLSRLFSSGADRVSKSVIFWFLTFLAQAFLPIFFVLCRQLAASAKVIEMDDAHTRINKNDSKQFLEKIITKPETDAEKIAAQVHAEIGLAVTGDDENRCAFLSLLTGLLDPSDPMSRVAIKLTHFGQSGKLLNRLLNKYRNHETHPKLWVVSDLASTNNLKPEDEEKFGIQKCGCMWHARRRFYAARHLDDLMWYAIRCFNAFARLEAWLKRSSSSEEQIARRRKRYGRIIRIILQYACKLIQKSWEEGTAPWKAADYFLENEHVLTQFLRYPFVPISNNRCERLLRPEKLMLSASKFRDTMGGRVTYDVISTIMASCGVSRTLFLPYAMDVLKNRDKVEANPEEWTPIAWRERRNGTKKL